MAHQVRVNPIACEAHGMCAELLPERITLDEWGYPVIDGTPLERWEVEHAKRAARACPTFALRVERERERVARTPASHSPSARGGLRSSLR